MPLELDKKKEVMRTQVKLECQQAGEKNLLFCWFGTVLLLHLVCVSPPLLEERKETT